MEFKPGHYWIKCRKTTTIARWNGKSWNHNTGMLEWFLRKITNAQVTVVSARLDDPDCPIGCDCILLPDGKIRVIC